MWSKAILPLVGCFAVFAATDLENLPFLTEDEAMEVGVKYTLYLYKNKNRNITSLNQLRWHLTTESNRPASELPPTDHAFRQHLKRCRYQLKIWYNSHVQDVLQEDPTGHGWTFEENIWKVTFSSQEPVPNCIRKTLAINKKDYNIVDSCSPKACQRDADSPKPVCGSDGLTYPNRCIFEKARCQNKNVTVGKRGPCKKQRLCSEWSNFNQQNAMYNNSFIPKCRPDGSYDSAQCHLGANFCWCVTPEGLPLPYTSSRRKNDNKPPKCGRKKSNRRRSSPANRRQQRNKICKRTEKSMLNNNLINSFQTEFTRESGRNDSDSVVITWKFRTLDQNSDHILDKFEYRDLRRVVRKVVKPKKCARQFPRVCDLNKDGRISLQEWNDCLTRDGRMDMDDGSSQNTSNDNEADDDNTDYEDPFAPGKSTPHEVLNSAFGSMGGMDDDTSEVAEDPTDCLSDRKTALSENYQLLYVPACTPDGRYEKVQCYQSAGYCWCVNEDTGKNIPGTSVKNGTPNCEHLKTNTRVMKGCPDDKKFIFLKELLNFLHNKMSEITNGTNTSSFNNLAWIASKEEQVATWSFVIFDKNKNKMLERTEWKAFKDMVGGVKGLRKCGKKLPRYCDTNKDRQISMTEWLECLSVRQGVASIPSISSSPRAGKTNPLSMLKDD